MRARYIPVLFLSALLVSAASARDQKLTYPAQILLIRHAEKPPEGSKSVDLSDEGLKRANALPGLFKKTDTRPDPFPTPDFIFATRNTKHSHRPLETVTPLARVLGEPILAEFKDDEFARLAEDLFKNPKYAGKTVLICWHHGEIPNLARALKGTEGPDHWKGSVFDRVWRLSYGENGKVTFVDRPQQLLPGDSRE